jgi:hypothetical protein
MTSEDSYVIGTDLTFYHDVDVDDDDNDDEFTYLHTNLLSYDKSITFIRKTKSM